MYGLQINGLQDLKIYQSLKHDSTVIQTTLQFQSDFINVCFTVLLTVK